MVTSLGTRIRPIGCVASVALLLAFLPINPITLHASTLSVTTCSGDGGIPGSLPYLVAHASAGDVITFSLPCTGANRILVTDTITIAVNLTIRASGIAVVVDGGADPVSHAGGEMIFEITDAVTDATISGLTIQNGNGVCAGGICNDGVLTVANSTIANNVGTEAGAIQSTNRLMVTNSTITGNISGGTGGILNEEGDIILTNVTIAGNIGRTSGGIGSTADGDETETLANTIVASNSGGNCSRAVTDGGHNLQYGDLSCGSAIPQQNPLLAALGDYGGPTQTMGLLPGSPAIDAGDDTICASTGVGGVNSRDQRGFGRPSGAHCDIGAFESRGFTLSISGGNNQAAPGGAAFPQPLAVTVTARDAGLPVQGGQVTFTPPSSGASARLSTTIATISGTSASVTATANAFAGQYQVIASTTGATPVSFTLTNTSSLSLASISVSPSSATLKVGDIVPFKATGTYSDGSTQDISGSVVWTSTDTTVLTVDAAGNGQGRIPGGATIHATLGSVTGGASVTVVPPSLRAITPPPARPGGVTAAGSSPVAIPAPRP